MAKSIMLPMLVGALLNVRGSWAQDDSVNVTLQPTVMASGTAAASASRRSDDSNGAQIESLLELANSILTSAYPSTVITDIATLEWPSSTTSSDPTTTPIESSTSSTSEPTEAARTPEDDSADGGGVSLGLILGIVFGVVALLLILLAACLYRRRRSKKRQGSGTETPSDDGSDLLRMHRGRREFPEKYNTIPAPPPPRTASPQFNRYSADENTLKNPFTQTSPVPATSIHPAHRNESAVRDWAQSSPYYAPHLHSTPPMSSAPPLPHQSSGSSGSSRDSGYYGHSRDGQIAELPGNQPPHQGNYPSKRQSFENPFTSPAYRVRSQSNTSISRRPVAKDSVTSLTRRSDNRLSSQLVSELSEESSEPNVAPGTPYVPPRSPKRRSGTYVHYPTVSETSDFDFGFNNQGERVATEAGNPAANSFSNRVLYGRQ